MLQNITFLKVGGGLVTVGGATGVGYYAHTQGLFKFQNSTSENPTVKDYLIVKSTLHTSTANGEIYDYSFLSTPKKNFICSSSVVSDSTQTKDEECEIYKLSDAEKKLAVAIDNNKSATTQNIKENGNYFKITLPKLFNEISEWDGTSQLINISEKNDVNKLFGKLTPIYKVKNGEIVKRKNSFLYAKVKETSGTAITQPSNEINTTNKNYQCQLATQKFDCNVLELTLNTTNKTINLPAETAPTKEKLKTKDTHFQIEIEEKYLNQFKFENDSQIIEIIEKTNPNANQHYAKLTPLFKTLDKNISGKDNFLLSVVTSDSGTGESTNGYTTCSINSSASIDCEIYKFATTQNSTENISFSSNLTKTEAGSDIQNGKHFVIKIAKNASDINNLKPDTNIKLTSTNSSSNKKEYLFTVKKRLFIDPTSDSSPMTVNTVHLLDI